MRLTKRQQTLIQCIPQCESLADVGCDHGYIGITALTTDIAKYLYLTDISSKSLDKASTLCHQLNIDQGRYKSVCQDGLQDIVAQVAIIAGMGGLEIISILDSAVNQPTTLVLQPMRNQIDVRQYLTQHGYNIAKDYIITDNKYYTVIVANKCDSQQTLDPMQLAFGLTNMTQPNEDFVRYIDNEINKCKEILASGRAPKVDEYLALLNKAREDIGGLL